AEALSKPLLHTWSLGVEEQFYLIWPFLILMLLKLGTWKKFVIGLLCLALASFLLNAAFMDWGLNDFLASREGKWELFMSGDSSAFYLMPFRIFQFGIGAMLAAWVFRRSNLLSEGVASLLLLISLLL